MIAGERRRCHADPTNTTSLLFGDDPKYRERRVDRGGRVVWRFLCHSFMGPQMIRPIIEPVMFVATSRRPCCEQ